jgi:hypothetical protein
MNRNGAAIHCFGDEWADANVIGPLAGATGCGARTKLPASVFSLRAEKKERVVPAGTVVDWSETVLEADTGAVFRGALAVTAIGWSKRTAAARIIVFPSVRRVVPGFFRAADIGDVS